MQPYLAEGYQSIARCRRLAGYTEEPGCITRTFLSEPMRGVHADVREWMEQAGMAVHVDAAGNIRGVYASTMRGAPRIIIGSHLDTVPHAGAFDGILGVVLGIALVELLGGRRLHFDIEVVGFSEEEGVRFGVPCIGSRALTGEIDGELLARRDAAGVSVADAIRAYGLDPGALGEARVSDRASAYLELHIEQGPVLESLNLPLGVVTAIAGQSRWEVRFEGQANHAGTTPMHLRHDALAGASEWIGAVEREAAATPDLVATVGRIAAQPGAANIIAGVAAMSLDVRHTDDAVRADALKRLLSCAGHIAARRGLSVNSGWRLDQPAVAMEASLVEKLALALRACGYSDHRMPSGAGHDAMILARRMPVAMLFLRSPGGISHHPDESVLPEDVAGALATGVHFFEQLETAWRT
jgi:allantoate deiminase